MVFFGYLTNDGKDALKNYKYSGADLSLIYKYILSPWAQYCVDTFTPLWIAPNTITLIGLLFPISSAIWSYYLNYDYTNGTTQYTALYAAFCIFFYSTLDNMDGKHARRTGASSPLGLLFDHGCDAINAGLVGWLIVSLHFNTGANSWTTFVQFICTTMVFFFNTYEEYHIGTLILPTFNGANEGLVLCIITLLVTAYYGSAVWNSSHTMVSLFVWLFTPVIDTMRWIATIPTGTTITSTSVYTDCTVTQPFGYIGCWIRNFNTFGTNSNPTNIEILLAFLVVVALSTVSWQIYNVCRFEYTKSNNNMDTVYAALKRQLPYWLLLITMTLWLHDPVCAEIVRQNWLIFYSTGGILFVDMVTKLMVSHVANQEYTPLYNGIVLFSLAPIFIKLNLFHPSFVTSDLLASFYLLLSFSYGTVTTTGYLLDAIEDITSTLDIDVFSITKQVQRANATGSGNSKSVKTTPLSPASTSIASASVESTGSTGTSRKRIGSASPAARKRR